MFDPQGPTFLELARQALSSTERGYDLLAPKFDHTPFRTPDVVLDPVAACLEPAGRALDVCCGTGAAFRILRPIAEEVVGVDFSQGMLAEAKRSAATTGGAGKRASVHVVRADARNLPFAGAFDLAVCFGALGHFVGEDQDLFLAAIARALRKGGRFVFVTSGHVPWSSPAFWLAKGFNAAMHVRNALRKPEFVMFYLTFLLPDVIDQLDRHGFDARVDERARFPRPISGLKVVVATRR